jgi:hypothetical protein
MGLLNPENPLINTIIFYIISISLLIYYKPKIIYDKKTKKFKQFGLNKDKSILCLPVLAMLIAIIYYIFFFYFASSIEIYQNYKELINKNKL